jgi:hypothetical protein
MHYHAYVLVPRDVKNVEEKVSELMAPYAANRESIPYPRECECVYGSAMKKLETGQYAVNGTLKGLVIEFTKEAFDKNGAEIVLKLELLRLGSPDPQCEDCQGSGICTTKQNYLTKWDYWDMGINVTAGALKDCIESDSGIGSDQWSVPMSALNLAKVPIPRAVVTPDGVWHTCRKFIWFSNAMIVDENWETSVKALLEAHKDSTLVVVDYHL